MRLVPSPEFIEPPGEKNVVKRKQRAQNYGKEKKKTRHPQGAEGRFSLLAGRALAHQFQFHRPHELFGVDGFGLAVAVGIHRKES